jgi:protein-tyrosine phosphatase
MLQMEAEQGITQVVATPHFYAHSDSPERFLRRRSEAESRLREALEMHPELPKVKMAAEVYFFRGISHSDAIFDLTIDNKGCILIEMPMPPWSNSMYRDLEGLHSKQGLVPIVAHIDRYIGRFRTFGIPSRLEELPVLVQANADFFLEKRTASMAFRMLRKGQINLLGSDCHNRSSRKPNLDAALEEIEQRLGDRPLREICRCQRHVLQNE